MLERIPGPAEDHVPGANRERPGHVLGVPGESWSWIPFGWECGPKILSGVGIGSAKKADARPVRL